MDNGSKPAIPPVVTEDVSPIPTTHVDNHEGPTSSSLPTTDHGRKPSDLSLLSPGILEPRKRPADTSASEGVEASGIPPSPVLSTRSSIHFKTTTALRENKPGDGTTSLSLLIPQGDPHLHSRRPSNAATTSAEEETTADSSSYYSALSEVTTPVWSAVDTLSSPTPTHVGSISDIGDSESRVKGNTKEIPEEESDDEHESMRFDLIQDEYIDPTPFAFKPYHLASLVDPKNLETLEGMGGIEGLLAGLGVDPNRGINIGGRVSESVVAPAAVVIDPADEKGGAMEEVPHEGGAYSATFEDRQRVYGFNILPARTSKSLLQLMLLAFKDRILVSPSRSHVYRVRL